MRNIFRDWLAPLLYSKPILLREMVSHNMGFIEVSSYSSTEANL